VTTSILKVAGMVLAVTAGATAAYADGGFGKRGQMDFTQLDADGSGEIDASDLEALRNQKFADLDTDGDGAVSEAEFIAHAADAAQERAAQMFARMDADGDGSLSMDALQSRGGPGLSERFLSRADTDGSGGISEEEFDAIKDKMAKRGGRDGKKKRGQN